MSDYVIRGEDELLRRVPKKPSHINNGRVTSAAFKTFDNEDGLSVDILKITTVEKSVPNPETHFGVTVLAQLPISLGYECIHKPEPAPINNYAHALIVGDTRPIAKQLAAACKQVYDNRQSR